MRMCQVLYFLSIKTYAGKPHFYIIFNAMSLIYKNVLGKVHPINKMVNGAKFDLIK